MLLMAIMAIRSARREWWTLGVAFVWFHGLWDYPMQQTPAFASLQIAFWGAALTLHDTVQNAAGQSSESFAIRRQSQNTVRSAVAETYLPL
jgi:hypothetical protein